MRISAWSSDVCSSDLMAAHTGNMQARPDVSLLVAQSEAPGEPVHALPRVTLTGRAFTPERDSPHWQACKSAYLERFPDAESMTRLNDFRFVAIHFAQGRQNRKSYVYGKSGAVRVGTG